MSNLFPTLDEVTSGQVTMKREGGVYRVAGTPRRGAVSTRISIWRPAGIP